MGKQQLNGQLKQAVTGLLTGIFVLLLAGCFSKKEAAAAQVEMSEIQIDFQHGLENMKAQIMIDDKVVYNKALPANGPYKKALASFVTRAGAGEHQISFVGSSDTGGMEPLKASQSFQIESGAKCYISISKAGRFINIQVQDKPFLYL